MRYVLTRQSKILDKFNKIVLTSAHSKMQGKQNQWLHTLSFPRQETLSKQIMQLEGSSTWSVTYAAVPDRFPLFFERDITLKLQFSCSKMALFLIEQNGWLVQDLIATFHWSTFQQKNKPIASFKWSLRERLERDTSVVIPAGSVNRWYYAETSHWKTWLRSGE